MSDQDRIDELENEVGHLERVVGSLEDEIDELNKTARELGDDKSDLEDIIDARNDRIEELETENESLESKVEALTRTIDILVAAFVEVKAQVDDTDELDKETVDRFVSPALSSAEELRGSIG